MSLIRGNVDSSPKFRNVMSKKKHSPMEIKEKMRKDYKNKVRNCRGMLLNKYRESFNEQDLSSILSDLYKSVLNYTDEVDDIEEKFLEDIRNELIQDELNWWIKEYETSQLENYDWTRIEENCVICPVCQKNNFKIENNIVSCSCCNIFIKTQMPASEIKKSILDMVQLHSDVCNTNMQFSVISEVNENHIYAICDSCNEMKIVM